MSAEELAVRAWERASAFLWERLHEVEVAS